MNKNYLNNIIKKQIEFQKNVGFPIESILESDRNELSEKYIFKAIEELIEVRKEFPSVMNPWSKNQKNADREKILNEFSDVLLFLINFSIVWKIKPEEILESIEKTQSFNFSKMKERKMKNLNDDILKIPGYKCGIGYGNINPKYIFVGQNPGNALPYHGCEVFSKEENSGKILLPGLKNLNMWNDSYITNLVKNTTESNLEPSDTLVTYWIEYFNKELEILKINNEKIRIIALGDWTYVNLKKYGFESIKIKHPAYYLRMNLSDVDYENNELSKI